MGFGRIRRFTTAEKLTWQCPAEVCDLNFLRRGATWYKIKKKLTCEMCLIFLKQGAFLTLTKPWGSYEGSHLRSRAGRRLFDRTALEFRLLKRGNKGEKNMILFQNQHFYLKDKFQERHGRRDWSGRTGSFRLCVPKKLDQTILTVLQNQL